MAEHSSRPDSRLSGFHAVLDRDDPGLAEQLCACSTVLQVRLKPASTAQIVAAARMAREVTRRHGVLLVVNDRVDVALAVEADAVHLGQDDLPLAAARALAPHLLIGVSTHDVGQVACAQTADYLGYGPVFPTVTKANPDPVQGLEALAKAVQVSKIPVIAIGGVTPERAAQVAATGAAGACAISSVNGSVDVIGAGRAIAEHWRMNTGPERPV